MSMWRYRAIPVRGPESTHEGEVAGESAAAVRRALRHAGLQVLQIRPVRISNESLSWPTQKLPVSLAKEALADAWRDHLRGRRRLQRADLYDGLATLLESGLPLIEAISTMINARRGRTAMRTALIQIRESLRTGHALDAALAAHPRWFDGIEIAMVRAAQHGGTLPHVLRELSARHQRAGQIGQKIAAALAYPVLLSLVGLVVVAFLSLKTLPKLLVILQDAEIAAPPLTLAVMRFGQALVQWSPALVAGVIIAIVGILVLRAALARGSWRPPSWATAFSPPLMRRIAVANFATRLAELMRSGVPVVEALHVLAPTARQGTLRWILAEAARRVERGEELSAALNDERWFDAEFRSLLDIGQASGELDELLLRIGARYERSAERSIERLSALLEPAAILLLAVLVGVVVMAAVLPLLRLQEVV